MLSFCGKWTRTSMKHQLKYFTNHEIYFKQPIDNIWNGTLCFFYNSIWANKINRPYDVNAKTSLLLRSAFRLYKINLLSLLTQDL